jgi:hypothetical protein
MPATERYQSYHSNASDDRIFVSQGENLESRAPWIMSALASHWERVTFARRSIIGSSARSATTSATSSTDRTRLAGNQPHRMGLGDIEAPVG